MILCEDCITLLICISEVIICKIRTPTGRIFRYINYGKIRDCCLFHNVLELEDRIELKTFS
jgi:hypothetical protein